MKGLGESHRFENVARPDAIIIVFVHEPERKNTLLLQRKISAKKLSICHGYFTFKFVSWIRANDRATIIAHPSMTLSTINDPPKKLALTIKAWLQCGVLPGTSLPIVFVNDKCPRLLPSFEPFGDIRNRP